MEARFPGTCAACAGPIIVGDQIKQDVRPAEHEVCPGQSADDAVESWSQHHNEAGAPAHAVDSDEPDDSARASDFSRVAADDHESGQAKTEATDQAGLTGRQRRIAAAQQLLARLQKEEADAERKRADADAAREKLQDEKLAAARGRHLKRLYETKGIGPVKGDRGEAKRFAALLAALGISEGS